MLYSSNVVVIQFKEGDLGLFSTNMVIQYSSEDKYHVVTEYDTLIDLATRYYGTPEYWHVIAIANSIIDPFFLSIGQVLIIPQNPYN